MTQDGPTPVHVDLDKARGLSVEWDDGVRSFYPLAHLRRLSPSADQRELRKQMKRNPLTVLPSAGDGAAGGLTATGAELVGNYALKVTFSDGHATGLYTWAYLRAIDPARMEGGGAPGDDAPPHQDPLGLGSDPGAGS